MARFFQPIPKCLGCKAGMPGFKGPLDDARDCATAAPGELALAELAAAPCCSAADSLP